ncbi:MAG: TlyA family RNA methyltransferase [Bacteriovoracaceae bacterium]|nr:TlyA family RNA methyltransferase [Bacteriovoracaceae bacterium]
MRVDKALTELKLAKSRTHAQDLIDEGVVYYRQVQVKKASQEVELIDLEVRKEIIYVSRGAYKLKSAAELFKINFSDKIMADVGASTGGFTDFCLRAGAQKVYALDVGHDQLDPSLRADARVINLEGVNIKNGYQLPEKVDVVVADLSFISLKLVLVPMMNLLNENGEAIVLVKPQFEVGPKGLDKSGIVKDALLAKNAILELWKWGLEQDFFIVGFGPCGIAGKDGNQEYFFHLKKGGNNILESEIEKYF